MLVTRTTGVSRFFSSLTPLKQSGAKQSPVSNKLFMAAPFQRGQRRKKTGQGKSMYRGNLRILWILRNKFHRWLSNRLNSAWKAGVI